MWMTHRQKSYTSPAETIATIQFRVRRGFERGIILIPHLYADEKYVASPTRFQQDYIRVSSVGALVPLIEKGLKIRMSNKSSRYRRAPSLIAPESLKIGKRNVREVVPLNRRKAGTF